MRVLAAVVRIAALFVVPLLGAGALGLLAYLVEGEASARANALVYVGEGVVALVVAWRWYGLRAAGIAIRGTPSAYGWAAAYAAGSIGVTVAGLGFAGTQGTPASVVLGQLAFALLFNALAEELHFRGLVYTGAAALARRPLVAAIVAALLFAFLHLSSPEAREWHRFTAVAAHGFALAAFRARTGSVYPSVLAHGLANFGSWLVVPAAAPALGAVAFSLVSAAFALAFGAVVFALPRSARFEFTPRPV